MQVPPLEPESNRGPSRPPSGNLKLRPVTATAPAGTMGVPEMVFYSSVKRLISATLYRPILMLPQLATVLAALEEGDATPFVSYVISQDSRIPFSCKDEREGHPDDTTAAGSDDAFEAIMCTDGPHTPGNLGDFEMYAEDIQRQSKAAGAVNTLFKITCAGWDNPAKWRFTGGCPHFKSVDDDAKTKML